MSTTVSTNNEYRNLPVVQLQESPTNPRRRFDEHSLAELAESFRAQGILQPLLVRTIEDDKFEVVAGARRLRAARIAALETVPVRVVELSDAACVETQLVENIQREGVHPMEEAFILVPSALYEQYCTVFDRLLPDTVCCCRSMGNGNKV
jgi:ParB family chromosome partitioning protein